MSGEGKKREGMTTRRTGGLARTPPKEESPEREPEQSGSNPIIEVQPPTSPFTAMGIKKEERPMSPFSSMRETAMKSARFHEETKPRSKEEETLQTRLKEELEEDILKLDEWMDEHGLSFDLEKNAKGEYNDEGDVQTQHIFKILEEQAKQIKRLGIMMEHLIDRTDREKREMTFELEEAKDKQGNSKSS